MKNLVIATVLVMLTPSLGLAGQLDKNKCELKVHKGRAALRAQAGEKREREDNHAKRSNTAKNNGTLERG